MANLTLGTLILVGLVATASSCGASTEGRDLYEGHGFSFERTNIAMLTPEEFPILPWGWTAPDDKALKEIKECGFNLAGFVHPSGVKKVEEAGLKCIVSDPRISGSIPRGQEVTDANSRRRRRHRTHR